ncbi:MAG: biotin transporter BioY [Clostridia bacterium]|nr:biotin transporter BioY [Clostridia bacterium]
MKRLKTKDLAVVSLCAALMCVCAWIQFPSAVPFTLQTFAEFFIALTFGVKKSLAVTAVYILLGAVGLPVFSGFQGGVGALLGATGGFILGFIPSTVIVSFLKSKAKKGFVYSFVCCLPGLAVCYATGVLWYMFVYGGGDVRSAVSVCILPFVVPDIIKIILAVTVARRVTAIIK